MKLSILYFLSIRWIFTYCMQRGTVLEAGGSEASFLLQCYILTKRSFINMSRDFGYYWLRLVIYIVVTICIGTIYLNVGTGYNSILVHSFYNPREIQSCKVSFSFLQIYLFFCFYFSSYKKNIWFWFLKCGMIYYCPLLFCLIHFFLQVFCLIHVM